MNKKELRKMIKDKGDGYCIFAKRCGILPFYFILKLYGIGEFRLWEIKNIIHFLNLNEETAEAIFFDIKVS